MKLLTKSLGIALLLCAASFTVSPFIFSNPNIFSAKPEVNMSDIAGIWVYKSFKDGMHTYAKS